MAKDTLTTIIREGLDKSISYQQYTALVDQLVKDEQTSGPKQHEDLVYYTKLNAQRGRRLNKTTVLSPQIQSVAQSITRPQIWLVISESWCGDAAQTLPLIHKLAEANDLIELRIVFRDEQLPLMDEFLTNGGRSIPKLLVLNEGLEVLGTWGPRPKAAQELYNTWKNDPNKQPYREFQVEMQKWYLVDKGQSTFAELSTMLEEINSTEAIRL